MIVPYKEIPGPAHGWPRPILPVAIADMDETTYPCLVDSGALNTLLPRWLADAAGLNLRQGQAQTLAVPGATAKAVFLDVHLTAAGHSWEASVGFCHPWPFDWGLLGQRSFFRFFTVEFRAVDFEFEVTPVRA